MTSRPNVVDIDVAPIPDPTGRAEARQQRVLALLRHPPCYVRGPGVAWWQLRQHLTGRVSATQLQAILDELLDEGIIVECRYWAEHRRQEARRFVLPRDAAVEPKGYQLLQIRGRADVLADLGFE